MPVAPAEAPPISIVIAVVASDLGSAAATLSAVRAQVYGPSRIVVVGGDSEARRAASDGGDLWVANVGALLSGLAPDTSHVWFLSGGSKPRPDALLALVDESERVEAGIAGSKLLEQEDPERLVSVGMATDVFDSPYTGLDQGEIDAGQYDVLRDVAAVGGASLLVRRDLARGLGGPDPLMAPSAAAIDLCQRARLRGGRVVVVPSSEVLVPESKAPGWREEAGQIRAMIKAYSLVTLLWALPAAFLLGLLESIIAPFLGRWTLFSWIRAWLWNLFHLPSTLRGRWAARHNRAVGDTELFRFQLRGSADMRRMGSEAGVKLRDRMPGDDRLGMAELGRDLRQPAFVVGALVVAFVLVSARSLWNGFPAVGFSLPLPESGQALAGTYAGGWNPAGFGSIEPLPPFVGMAGIVQTILFGNPGLASGVLIAGAFLAGAWGMTRLLRTWGIEAVPGALAGVVLMAGPAARAIGAETGLGTLVALGVLPWALRVPLSRWPAKRWPKVGRIAGAAWVSGLLALASPLLLPVPFVTLLVLALITPREAAQWRAALVSLLGSLLALPLLLPWLGTVDLGRYTSAGAAYWEPGIILAVAAVVMFLTTMLAAPKRLAQVTGWAGVVAAAGAFAARSADLGSGREVELVGLAMVALGSAVVVGVALELLRQAKLVTGWNRILAGIGFVGAGAILASTVLVLLPGRAGLPADELTDAMRFTAAAAGDPASSRVLLIGPEDQLPGESRSVQGASYRVVSAPSPDLWEVWLPEQRSADVALEAVLDGLVSGESFRAGSDLAPFGIRWIIALGESPLEAVFAGQLDLVPLQGLAAPTFVSEAEDPVRAQTLDGVPWSHTLTGYEGEPDSTARVFVAENANSRWGSEWSQLEWGNEVSGAEGVIDFAFITNQRSQAIGALVIFVLYVLTSWWGRRRR